MKMIIAFIKRHKLSDVTLALKEVEGLSGVSITDVRGFGRGRGISEEDVIRDGLIDYLPRIRLEIACTDELVDRVVSVIEQHAHTGLRGDGKIYAYCLDQAVRISSGERGETAT
jgi:nitrogen regulatory protein P-II 1